MPRAKRSSTTPRSSSACAERAQQCLKKALSDRVDAAVAAGRLTKEQGAELKARIASDDFPLFGPPGMGGGVRDVEVGLALPELQDAALVARRDALPVGRDRDAAHFALVAAERDARVVGLRGGRSKIATRSRRPVTQAQETRILADLDQRIGDFVNGKLCVAWSALERSTAVPRMTAGRRLPSWGLRRERSSIEDRGSPP